MFTKKPTPADALNFAFHKALDTSTPDLKNISSLIDQKADLNNNCPHYNANSFQSPLYLAACHNSLPLVQLLISKSADVNFTRPFLQMAIRGVYRCSIDNTKDVSPVLRTMIEAKLNVNTPVEDSPDAIVPTLLSKEASKHKNTMNKDILQMLIKAKANIHATNGDFSRGTAAHAAAGRGNPIALRLLMQAGTDMNLPDRYKCTVMDYMMRGQEAQSMIAAVREEEKNRKDCVSAALREDNLLLLDLIKIVVRYMEIALTFSELNQLSERPSQSATVANEEAPASSHTATNISTPSLS